MKTESSWSAAQSSSSPKRHAGTLAASVLGLLALSVFGSDGASALPIQEFATGPVPGPEELEKADAAFRVLFEDAISRARKPEDKEDLAREFVKQALDRKTSSAMAYVLSRRARELGVEAGCAKTVLQAHRALVKRFDLGDSGASELADCLTRLGRKVRGRENGLVLVKALLRIVGEWRRSGQYEIAIDLLGHAEQAAEKTRLRRSQSLVRKRKEAIEREWEESRRVKGILKSQPGSSRARLAEGRFLCLFRGDWDKGLPLLATCGDPDLESLAKEEMATSADIGEGRLEAQLHLAQSWSRWAGEKAGEGTDKDAFLGRAQHWYSRALEFAERSAWERIVRESEEHLGRPGMIPLDARSSDGKWYWFPDRVLSLDEARALALRVHGRLLRIGSKKENQLVAEYSRGPTFLGIERQRYVDRWVYRGYRVQRYFNWAEGSPPDRKREATAVLLDGSTWATSVAYPRCYVCVEWDARSEPEPVAREPRELAVLEFIVDTGPPGKRTLFSNGRLEDPHGDATWSILGRQMLLVWPTTDAAEGAWIDAVNFDSKRGTFHGRNQHKVLIRGRVLKGKI